MLDTRLTERTSLQWDQRLFTLDPVTMSHILQHTTIYEKPLPSRRLISGLIGVGMLSAEGQTHKRQRRVALPAFSLQNMRALVPLVFSKGTELKNKWMSIIEEAGTGPGEGSVIDVCRWASRATFDVMGSAGTLSFTTCYQRAKLLPGFDYEFNAIQNEDNELLRAYIEMFEVAVAKQGGGWRNILATFFPAVDMLFVSKLVSCWIKN